MNTTAKELALGGMFTALGVVLLCLGGVVPLALYACPILASAVLLPVRERCRKRIAWSCYAAIALLGTLLGPDKEASMLFVFLGYYPLVKPKLDAIHSRALRLSTKLLLAVFAVGVDYLFLLFVLRLDAVTQELAGTAPALLWATCALGLALFVQQLAEQQPLFAVFPQFQNPFPCGIHLMSSCTAAEGGAGDNYFLQSAPRLPLCPRGALGALQISGHSDTCDRSPPSFSSKMPPALIVRGTTRAGLETSGFRFCSSFYILP